MMQSHLQRGGRRLSQNSTPGFFLTHRRAILLPPELHRIFFPKEENERLRCLCLSQSPAEHFSHILSSLLNFLFAEFFGQCLDLFYVLFLHSGHYFYIILCPGDIFALSQTCPSSLLLRSVPSFRFRSDRWCGSGSCALSDG